MEWSDLPSEVMELILLRLPLLDIFRLRLVNRSWNALLRYMSTQNHVYWLTQSVSHAPCHPVPYHSPHGPPPDVHSERFLREDDDHLWRLCRRSIQHELSILCLCMRTQQQRFIPLPRHRFRPHTLITNVPAIDIDTLAGEVTCSVPSMRHLGAGGGSLVAELAFYCSNRLPPLSFRCLDTALIRVFNVLTGCFRQLPTPSRFSCTSSPSNSILFPDVKDEDWAYRVDPLGELRTKHYILHLLVSDDEMYYHLVIQVPYHKVQLFVYDSRCPGSWRLVCGMKHRRVQSTDELDPPVPRQAYHGHDIFKGDLFFPVVSKSLLFSYRVETDEWSKATFRGAFPSECFQSEPTVMKLKGTARILMVVHLSTHDPFLRRFTLHGFAMWELQQEESFEYDSNDFCTQGAAELHSVVYSWVEVARTPPGFLNLYDLLDPPRFLHSSTLICMTGGYHNHVDDRSRGDMAAPKRYLRPLAYDLMHGCWFFMPFDWMNSQELLICSSFQPSSPGLVP